ncbi:S8 family serine peptidase [Bacillaceae bacterium IKA-2]|nr:S8 family serine peptidase [Bacillaceae bacterium IKA-2]
MNLTGKTYFFFLAIILVLTTMLVVPTTESKSLKEEVIIIYKNDIGKAAIKEITNDISHQFSSIPALVVSLIEKDIIALAENPNIKSVEKNCSFTIIDQGFIVNPETQIYLNMNVIDSTDDHYQWNINEVNPKSTWNDGYTGKDVKVAVIDTGISPHPNLLIAGGVSTVSYNGSWADDNGHGTHVAGTIAAKDNNNGKGIVGIAPDVKIYAVKALDENGKGTLLTVLNAIEWSIINDIDIINFSLGTDSNIAALKDIIDVAYDLGITMVAAAGNTGNLNGTGNSVNYPAKYESVIAISAVDESLTRASFSSTGKEIEFSAPGINIISTYLDNQYANASGTSFATPHISGMLAILKQMHPEMMNVELRNELKKYTIDLGNAGRDPWYGHGFVKYVDITPAQISRIGGVNLYETSALISQEGWDKSDVVILARGDRFSDALTGVPLATKHDAPLLLSRSNRLDTFTKAELQRLEAKQVIILGGHLAIEKGVETAITNLGIKVTRLAGANMHATAELIAKEVAPNGSGIAIIVSDNRFQDALSVASYAGVHGIPILLANTKNLPSATQRALHELGVKETLVIGGELAISSAVEKLLPAPKRIAGQTMFDTNIKVFNYFQPNTDKVYVATSERFQDGLSGGALAARQSVGVLLVGAKIRDITKDNIITTNYRQVNILGGELAVNADVFAELSDILR